MRLQDLLTSVWKAAVSISEKRMTNTGAGSSGISNCARNWTVLRSSKRIWLCCRSISKWSLILLRRICPQSIKWAWRMGYGCCGFLMCCEAEIRKRRRYGWIVHIGAVRFGIRFKSWKHGEPSRNIYGTAILRDGFGSIKKARNCGPF